MNDANFISIWLEGFFYGKPCALTCTLDKKSSIVPRSQSRTLFRDIRHIFTMPIGKVQVQDGNLPFLRRLSSICSICCFLCQWSSSSHTWSKSKFYLSINILFLHISCADTYRDTIASTSNWLEDNSTSHFQDPSHSIRLLRFPRSMCSSTHKPLYLLVSSASSLLTYIFKDLPLLDRVESKYLCHDHSFILGIRIHRSVWLSLSRPIFVFIIWFQFIASSFVATRDNWRNNICTGPIFDCCLGERDDYNKSHCVHGGECPGDGLDRVQDPQGVDSGRGNFGLRRRGWQTSTYHIHYNWIWYGVVCHPTDSPRVFHPARGFNV